MVIWGRMGWLEAAQSAKYIPQSWSVYLSGVVRVSGWALVHCRVTPCGLSALRWWRTAWRNGIFAGNFESLGVVPLMTSVMDLQSV